MKRVSIIVPAYNSHDTLARCLGSLVNQTLEDIEIIVVNDASTDDTWEIMERCEKQYSDKVTIVDCDVNRGSGGARNQGIDLASGEYIGFVDSDDYVAANMYELLYSKAVEGDFDIVDCGYYSQANDKALLYTDDAMTGDLNDDKRNLLIPSGGYLVTKIFKKELWDEPLIREREGVRCLEDTEILIYMFLRANSIGNVKEVLYNYCDNEGSATKTMDLNMYYESIYGAIEAIYNKCSSMKEYSGVIDAVEYSMINLYSYGVNRCIYDQIMKYGANVKNVKKYFDDLAPEANALLQRLAALKKEVITCKYRDNKDVVNRISELDILIMEECDRRNL